MPTIQTPRPRVDRARLVLASALVAGALLAPSLASAQACPVGTQVAPGTCVCPSGTSYRTSAAQGNICPATGACTCNQGTWNGSSCFVPPPPPPPPPPPGSCSTACGAGTACVNGVCVKTGPLQVSLWWDTPGDLDLRVLVPTGTEINYTRRTDAGGEMDRDDRRGTGPENIYWQTGAPPGAYTVCVDSRLRGGTAAARPTARFTVAVTMNGVTQTFTGTRTGTVVERACRAGGPTAVTTFNVAGGIVPPPVVTPPPGGVFGSPTNFNGSAQGNIFFLAPNTQALPTDWSRLTPQGTIYADRWDIAPRNFSEGFPGVTQRFEWFAIRYTGQFQISRAGSYAFRLHSDDGSRLIIDGRPIVNNDGQHAPGSAQGMVQLSAGVHTIELQYFQGPQYQIALQLFVTPPGGTERIFTTTGL